MALAFRSILGYARVICRRVVPAQLGRGLALDFAYQGIYLDERQIADAFQDGVDFIRLEPEGDFFLSHDLSLLC